MTLPIGLDSGYYDLQKRMPKDIAKLTGKTVIKRSLRTRDAKEAKSKIMVQLDILE